MQLLILKQTGGSPDHEKITEIAIFLYDGANITGQFSSLINPEKKHTVSYHGIDRDK